jgi:hypothetical protein
MQPLQKKNLYVAVILVDNTTAAVLLSQKVVATGPSKSAL